MLLSRVVVPDTPARAEAAGAWPLTVPAVARVVADGLVLTAPVTFLVGENGSGKSTLVEAVAEGCGLDARGGRAGRKYVNDRPKTALGELVSLEWTHAGHRWLGQARTRRKGYFHRAETAFGFMETVAGMPGYWPQDTSAMSHGEGFLTVFDEMFDEPGMYVLDEPEAALSFASTLRLLALLHRLGAGGSQVVCATHSPVLASLPGADVVELGEHGLRRTTWADLDLVAHWRRYLDEPERYLRHLLAED